MSAARPEAIHSNRNQRGVLLALHKHGRWSRSAGWVWNSTITTLKTLNALVEKGYAARAVEDGVAVYVPTDKPIPAETEAQVARRTLSEQRYKKSRAKQARRNRA